MLKKLIFLFPFFFLLLFGSIVLADDSKVCSAVALEREKLINWSTPALQNNHSNGCPSFLPATPLYNLEQISKQRDVCGEKAAGVLIGFYAIFAHHPNYEMCALSQKEELAISRAASDREICSDSPSNKIYMCFLNVNKTIANLKNRGELRAAFDLASKTADSGDATGLSQMSVGVMYGYGEGVDKNLQLAIKWLKEALELTNIDTVRNYSLISLSVFYEELGDIQKAKQYVQQCTLLGDVSCKRGLARLSSKGHSWGTQK